MLKLKVVPLISDSIIESLLKNIMKFLSQGGEPIKENGFLELYQFNSFNQEKGIVVIDQSDGCFPLVLYPESQDDIDSSKRISAFEISLKGVLKNLSTILSILKKSKDMMWTKRLQAEILNTLPH